MSNYVFAEIVINGAQNRGNVQRVESILKLDYFGKPLVTDAYSSVYLHTEDYAAFTDGQGGKRGYTGAVKAEYLHFDFDSPENDCALHEVRQFTEKLCSNDKYGLCIDDFRFFFSGNKGFHAYIVSNETAAMKPGAKVPDRVKKICMYLAGNYSSFDRTVYDRTRIFRIKNSNHGKSGLFKIPVYAGELWQLSLAQIKKLAQKQRSLKSPETIKEFNYGIA